MGYLINRFFYFVIDLSALIIYNMVNRLGIAGNGFVTMYMAISVLLMFVFSDFKECANGIVVGQVYTVFEVSSSEGL